MKQSRASPTPLGVSIHRTIKPSSTSSRATAETLWRHVEEWADKVPAHQNCIGRTCTPMVYQVRSFAQRILITTKVGRKHDGNKKPAEVVKLLHRPLRGSVHTKSLSFGFAMSDAAQRPGKVLLEYMCKSHPVGRNSNDFSVP